MPPDDIADEIAVNNRRRFLTRQRLSDDEVLKSILRTVTGRSWVWRLLERCHIFASSYSPGSFDSTAFREGERNVGLYLLTEINRADPQSYYKMSQENGDKDGRSDEPDTSNAD